MSSVTAVPLQPVKRRYKVWLWLGILAAIAGAFGLAWEGTRAPVMAAMTNAEFLDWNKGRSGVQTTPSGLQYQVLEEGEGPALADGQAVYLNYEGRLRDGRVFDKSSEPVLFLVREGASIPGFYEALKLMKKGGEYRLWIPSDLAYGARSPDPSKLPNDSILIFKVGVDRVMSEAEFRQMMMQQMMMQQQMQGGPPGGPPGQ